MSGAWEGRDSASRLSHSYPLKKAVSASRDRAKKYFFWHGPLKLRFLRAQKKSGAHLWTASLPGGTDSGFLKILRGFAKFWSQMVQIVSLKFSSEMYPEN